MVLYKDSIFRVWCDIGGSISLDYGVGRGSISLDYGVI